MTEARAKADARHVIAIFSDLKGDNVSVLNRYSAASMFGFVLTSQERLAKLRSLHVCVYALVAEHPHVQTGRDDQNVATLQRNPLCHDSFRQITDHSSASNLS